MLDETIGKTSARKKISASFERQRGVLRLVGPWSWLGVGYFGDLITKTFQRS